MLVSLIPHAPAGTRDRLGGGPGRPGSTGGGSAARRAGTVGSRGGCDRRCDGPGGGPAALGHRGGLPGAADELTAAVTADLTRGPRRPRWGRWCDGRHRSGHRGWAAAIVDAEPPVRRRAAELTPRWWARRPDRPGGTSSRCSGPGRDRRGGGRVAIGRADDCAGARGTGGLSRSPPGIRPLAARRPSPRSARSVTRAARRRARHVRRRPPRFGDERLGLLVEGPAVDARGSRPAAADHDWQVRQAAEDLLGVDGDRHRPHPEGRGDVD